MGIERHALELVRHLRKAGCTVTVFTTFWNGGNDGDQFEGITVRRATDLSQVIGRSAALFDLHYLTWGTNLLRYKEELNRCDVLHALGPLSSSETLTSEGLPLLTHFHHYETVTRPRELLYKPFHHRLESRAYRHSSLIAALSDHGAMDLQEAFRIRRERIRVIPDGVDLGRFAPRPKTAHDRPTILCVGAHEERKGLSYLWQALSLLQKGGMDFLVDTVGVGPETKRLKSLARVLGLERRIRFLGYVNPLGEELPNIYRDADVLVHPSLEEGFGMVLIEAMASGVPVVASNSGAIPEAVGDAGLLVPPRNPEALADAIRRVLTDSALSKSLSRRGQARVETLYSWDQIVQRTLEVYEETMAIANRSS